MSFVPYAPPTSPRGRPAVITWYRVYAVTTPLFYVLAIAVWQLGFPGHVRLTSSGGAPLLAEAIALVACLTALFTVAALVPYKPWGWTLGLLVICIGLMTCLAPAAIGLLVYWLRPTTKAAFCRL